MLNPHTSLGIAQTVFYLPMVPLAIWLMIRNGKIRPRMAWWPLIPFTMMRLAGGPVIIALESMKNADGSFETGLLIAAIILLNVGVIPLIVADLGLTRVILLDNFGDGPFTHRINVALRLTFVGAVGLLGAGGGIGSQDDAGPRHTGHLLTLIGYIVFAVELMVLTLMQIYYYTRKANLLHSGHQVLRGALLASPFIAVRTVYGIIEAAHSQDVATIWNPVYGSPETSSIVLFVFMALVVEYVALIIYLWSGFAIPPERGLPAAGDMETAGK
ncbi:hypothetical protein QQS21_005849 [Conoideocrella luteorostrata]|uniref:DUF7702 domain-containing protein n=1 Tax=Conoideocrella luteorostrata TaxID=1105319 RepID=A0AAJ0FYS0_9HYPO|nr:hypothetical protein QQS21_005849 [Conoideocrella luteorostrata]